MSRYEKVPLRPGMSWRHHYQTSLTDPEMAHHHLEYEINLRLGFSGRVQVGSHHSDLNDAHLLLIPPNMEHGFQSLSTDSDRAECHTIWFNADWLRNMIYFCPEMRKLEKLVKRAEYGVLFSASTSEKAHKILRTIDYSVPRMEQLTYFLKVLSVLSQDTSAIMLNAKSTVAEDEIERGKHEKIDLISSYLDSHYSQRITLDQLAEQFYISKSTLHRLFITRFGETFSQRLKKTRIGHAERLLESTTLSIQTISNEVGYESQANFNRQFKEYRGVTPREYRRHHSTNKK